MAMAVGLGKRWLLPALHPFFCYWFEASLRWPLAQLPLFLLFFFFLFAFQIFLLLKLLPFSFSSLFLFHSLLAQSFLLFLFFLSPQRPSLFLFVLQFPASLPTPSVFLSFALDQKLSRHCPLYFPAVSFIFLLIPSALFFCCFS